MNHIHQRALNAALRFKQAEAELIRVLQEIQKDFVFRQLGFTSLFNYCIEALGLSESTASNFVTVSRVAAQIPALQAAIQEGKIGVSKARKITPVHTRENQDQWVALAKSLPTRKLEEEVAKVAPQKATEERIKPIAEDRRELRVGISKELEEKLRRVQDLESQRTRKAATLEETLEALTEFNLDKKDPLRRAEPTIRWSIIFRIDTTCLCTKPIKLFESPLFLNPYEEPSIAITNRFALRRSCISAVLPKIHGKVGDNLRA